ncbi:hypothetical protein BRADO6935 [Bradyrhizobium sp. ORS 278]|uniref:hypothetical protein n=1 Tax=Bradyrhizobium sp. (strain ORS 278) TaxID=114615 RepID=UPI0001508F02|nr:hypothetical protein [Bradyrhizobium sp. ORS 278]CAL80525.1 hypothetical protein BRADO6935 [Bradyrhizobium sp. ORS 278]
MILPSNRNSCFLKAPVLVLVRRDPRKLTLLTLREVKTIRADPDVLSPTEVERLLTEHADTRPSLLFGSRMIQGSQLADRLAGRLFAEIGGVCLDLDSDLGKREWDDHANWIFPIDLVGWPQAPFNRCAVTKDTKARTPRHLATIGRNCPLQIHVPFASCDFLTSSFSFALHPDFGLVGNLDPGAEVTQQDNMSDARQAFSSISLTTDSLDLKPDAYATVTAQLVDSSGSPINDADAELHLETTGGYLPKQRVTTQQGRAQFRVGALGLVAGDSFRLKAGFRHFTGVNELEFRVT